MQKNNEPPYFNFNDEDWDLIKEALGELKANRSYKLITRMLKHEHDMSEFQKKQKDPTVYDLHIPGNNTEK